MIKYFTYDSFDEYGQHIIPVDSNQDLVKTAGSNYSSEIAKVIQSMVRKPNLYYVVINALGSYEVWGINGNGDAFPRKGLSHLSLRSDLGTANDYGYKTFEYYAKLFKHHVNKPDSPSYGEVVFSHWNDKMDRVELIVGIDRNLAPDIVTALDNGDNVAVSMGAKVRYDECSVCGNKAKTRAQYCKHAKKYLGKVIDEFTARQWSRELGKEILPGTKVHAINEFPRFFDISKVHVGADRTAYVLGKAASDSNIIASVDLADAYGVTDELFDKVAALGKVSEIEKEIGSMGPDDIDGRMSRISKAKMLAKAVKEKMRSTIDSEEDMPPRFLDSISEMNGPKRVLMGLLNSGIYPKPREFQRIILSGSGNSRLSDELDRRGMIFNHKSCSRSIPFNVDQSEGISRSLIPSSILGKRSFLPGDIDKRMSTVTITIKTASADDIIVSDLDNIAAMYDGFKKYASKITPSTISGGLGKTLLGYAAYIGLVQALKDEDELGISEIPASEFENVLIDTDFGGKVRYERDKTSSQLIDSLVLPGAYIDAATEQGSHYNGGGEVTSDWMSKQADLTYIIDSAMEKVNF